MLSSPAPQKPSNVQIKETCEAYLTSLEKITNEKDTVQATCLKIQADKVYATFTKPMKRYCEKRLEQKVLGKQIEEGVARLEEIDNTMGKVIANNTSFTEKLQGIVQQPPPSPMLVRFPKFAATSSAATSGATTSAAALKEVQKQVSNLAIKPGKK